MRTIHLLVMCFALALYGWTIPRTVFPVPEKRSMDAKAIADAAPYLELSPEKYMELVPKEGPAPVILDTEEQSSAYNSTICPFCGKTGKWLKYDLVADPDHAYCAQSGKDIMSFPVDGKDTFTDYNGRSYERAYFITPYVKPIKPKTGDVKVYPENYFARERIEALLGIYYGGALMPLARAYYATGDEKYAERAIAILYGFAQVMKGYPWTVHSSAKPQPREKLLECAERHDSGFHGWLGPARLAAAESNFRNPHEAMYFSNICNAYMMLEPSQSWNGRKEYVLENLIREGSIHFRAYGAKQCVFNAIGMYAPALFCFGVVLQDAYFYDGFIKIMDDFLYNENFHDGISTEGSVGYSSMVGGMWNQFERAGLKQNQEYMASHPFLNYAGKTRTRGTMLRGGAANYGDNHQDQYIIARETPKAPIPGEEYGGFGVSIVRAGGVDKRLELVFQHDRVTGHSHDDMLGMQLFYRGIPMLEHFGDTRDTKDLNDKVPDYERFKALKYPAPIVTSDARPRGFCLQDVNTPLTKNTILVDDYWESNAWYTAYRGGTGADHRASFGNLIARTGRMPEEAFQFVEAEGVDKNSKDYQGMRLYRRAFAVITRPDGTPYVVDFFAVDGGHRHTLLFHSRGNEISSTLGKGKDYAHLEDIPGVPDGEHGDIVGNFRIRAGNVLFPGKVLNNVNYGAQVRNSWHHSWEFDYAAWASKTNPPEANMLVKPHVISIHGLITNNDSKALRADGHFPQTITEYFNGNKRQYRFQFENAAHYAGILAQSRSRLQECYVNCIECHQNDEPAQFKAIRALAVDGGKSLKRAVEISFADGTKDIVFWQPFQARSTWDAEAFGSDARSGVIRLDERGRVVYCAMAGGTYLQWHRNEMLKGQGTLTGRIADIQGDITGHPEKSVLVLEGAEGWPEGTALKGRTLIAGYNRGHRRDAYSIDRIEHQGKLTYVYLECAPFFRDHSGKVLGFDGLYRQNQFSGTGTAKGGETRYLEGSQVLFPQLGKSYVLDSVAGQVYTIKENVNLTMEGIKPEMQFFIEPDWKGVLVEVATSSSMKRKFEAARKERRLSPQAKLLPGFIEKPDDNTLWLAYGRDVKTAETHSKYVWGIAKDVKLSCGKNDELVFEGSGSMGTYVPMGPGYPVMCIDVATATRLGGGYHAISFNFGAGGLPVFGTVGKILPGMYCIPFTKTPENNKDAYIRMDAYNANVVFNGVRLVKTNPCAVSFGKDMLKKGGTATLHFTLVQPADIVECRLYQTYTMQELQVAPGVKRLYAKPVEGTGNRQWIVEFPYNGFNNRIAGKHDGTLKPLSVAVEVLAETKDDSRTYIVFNDIPIEL